MLLAILDDHVNLLERLTASTGRDLIADLAAFALEHREFGVIWEREAGHLPPEQQRAIRHRLRAVAVAVAASPASASPASASPASASPASASTVEADLRSWAVLSVVGSPSHHRAETDRPRFEALLRAAARAVLTAPSRREALLGAAIGLFRDRGYHSVGLSDIGAAVGIAGPSVYNHFDSKNEILDAALNRGTEALWLGLHHALAAAGGPADALRRVVADYAAFAAANTGIVRLVVTELIHLPEERRQEYRQTQLNYIAEWTTLLSGFRPDLAGPDARILVQTAVGLINSLTRIPHLPPQPARVAALAWAVLSSRP
jgi:AcrR family transcriptional regulator